MSADSLERAVAALIGYWDSLDAVDADDVRPYKDGMDEHIERVRALLAAPVLSQGAAEPSEDAIAAVPITSLTEYESVQAAAVFHELNKRGDPYALTRTVEHILRMRTAGPPSQGAPEPPSEASEMHFWHGPKEVFDGLVRDATQWRAAVSRGPAPHEPKHDYAPGAICWCGERNVAASPAGEEK